MPSPSKSDPTDAPPKRRRRGGRTSGPSDADRAATKVSTATPSRAPRPAQSRAESDADRGNEHVGDRRARRPRRTRPTATATTSADATTRREQGPVRREPITKAQLERDAPSLRGKLDPPTSSKPPRGVKVHEEQDGTRVVSVNIHQAVPGKLKLDRENQDIDALRDVAAYVNSVDPDVVAVQEVNDHDNEDSGVPHQASVLYHLLDADDMSFTPALGHSGHAADKHREYGTATYTRNGHRIEQSHDVDLPNDRGDVEDRSAGVSVVRAPSGERTTVVNAHLSAGKEGVEVRKDQLDAISGIVEQVQDGGSFRYRDAIGEHDQRAAGLASDVIVTGDLNATRGGSTKPDGPLRSAGLGHASDDGRSWAERNLGGTPFGSSIDHVYRSAELLASGYAVSEIPADEMQPTRVDGELTTPTDHPLVVTDVRRR
jgi:endonuclease/exonuclease/phosphatase family metal-dependent hydrolase